jgi:putative transposase
MADIVALLQCSSPYLTATTIRQLSRIVAAIIAMSGRVTMLGVSRWAGRGGSYRTVQRFFYTAIPWAMVFWLFFRQHLLNHTDSYLLAGDETVVTKSGQQSYGLDRFFSSLYGKPVPGLSFLVLSLVSLTERRSYPLMVEQLVRSEAEKVASQAKKPKPAPKDKPKGKPGRPKGSKNKDKTQVVLTGELTLLQSMIRKQVALIDGFISVVYIALDGKFGNNNALQVVRGGGLHLVSKLRHDAALYFPYDGPYAGHGPYAKYGDKLDYRHIPARYRQETTVAGGIQTDIYQAQMWHKEFPQRLNIVIIVKTNLATQTRAHVILFCSDLNLGYQQLIDYYCLRFQLEFNFRDAKQYWGLEDFMNIQQTAVTNAANLSLFMVNLTQLLLRPFRQDNPTYSILDLKAHYRGHQYVTETIKLLPQKPEPFLLAKIFDHLSRLGSVHTTQPCLNSA